MGDAADVLGIESDVVKQINERSGAGFLISDRDELLVLAEGGQVAIRSKRCIECLDSLHLWQDLGLPVGRPNPRNCW